MCGGKGRKGCTRGEGHFLIMYQVCVGTLCITSYQLSVVTAQVPCAQNNFLSTVVLRCISIGSIFSCTTWTCFQMKCSVTPRCHLSRHLKIHKKPSSWSFVIRELFESSFLRTFPSTTEMGFAHQLSCSSIWAPSDPLAVPVAITFQNSQYCCLGFDCENLQVVNIHVVTACKM